MSRYVLETDDADGVPCNDALEVVQAVWDAAYRGASWVHLITAPCCGDPADCQERCPPPTGS